MEGFRVYGPAPYGVAVVHGGPGAAGEMAPVARELSRDRGVLEPLQSATTLEAQIDELREVLEAEAKTPVVLVGHSWGAWLAVFVAARFPALVSKLILVSSGAFESEYTVGLMKTRLERLSEPERYEALLILDKLKEHPHDAQSFARFGALMDRADSFDPVRLPSEDPVFVNPAIYEGVWPQASHWRVSGKLVRTLGEVKCEVLALHGDADTTPAEGVREPLQRVLPRARFQILEKCGHSPWREKQAREKFFEILRHELS